MYFGTCLFCGLLSYNSYLLVETIIIKFVLIPLFFATPALDYYHAPLALASFRWLLLVPSEGLDKFDLICAPFTPVTILSGLLRGLGYLFNQFLTFCNYCYTVLIYLGSIIEKLTPFLFLGSPNSCSCRIKSGSIFHVTISLLKKIIIKNKGGQTNETPSN